LPLSIYLLKKGNPNPIKETRVARTDTNVSCMFILLYCLSLQLTLMGITGGAVRQRGIRPVEAPGWVPIFFGSSAIVSW
jgi:hypothetical protein